MNLLITVLLCLGLASEAFPPVLIEVSEQRHAIAETDIRQKSRFHAPGSGLTRSVIELSTLLKPIHAGCKLEGLQLKLQMRTFLPESQIRGQSDTTLARRWQASVQALEQHENGHRMHALASAWRLRQRLLELGSKRSCMHLQLAINRIQQREMRALDERDQRFDERTAFGTRGSQSKAIRQAMAREYTKDWQRFD